MQQSTRRRAKVDQQQHSVGAALFQSVVVDAPPERAFAVFTAGMTSWWPIEAHSIGTKTKTPAGIEHPPRGGGVWGPGRGGQRGVGGGVWWGGAAPPVGGG